VRERMRMIEKREMSRKVYKIGFGSLNKVVVRNDESEEEEEEEEHCGCVVVVVVSGFCILRMLCFLVLFFSMIKIAFY
jgi:S-adenosylmethionine:diacylglycerol 3-amino-3-carboxypropyl transferase